MDLKDIQELVKMVSKSGVSHLEVEMDGTKVVVKNEHQSVAPVVVQQPQVITAPAPQVIQATAPAPAPVAAAPAVSPAAAPAADAGKYESVKSPMIGTFYRSPGPDKPVFVNVGDEVKKGQVLCIIEAMKLFNEIESEISGRIVKVLVDDSSPVEYDQPLFLVEPL